MAQRIRDTVFDYAEQIAVDKMNYECGNCDWTGRQDALGDIEDLSQRVDPGEPMPTGECPDCGALAHSIDIERYEERLTAWFDGLSACTKLSMYYAQRRSESTL